MDILYICDLSLNCKRKKYLFREWQQLKMNDELNAKISKMKWRKNTKKKILEI